MPPKVSQRTPADLYIIPCCPGQWSDIRASDSSYSPSVGFRTGNPRVGFYHTVPEPAYTVPVAGTGTHCTVNRAVSYETRGTTGTRGFLLIQLPFNLAKVVRTSIDVRRVFREVVG
jgi:hypothetical protein